METFFLAMTRFPEVLRCAQEEVDRVVGKDRLPTFEDRGDLPYINALIKELIRWEQILPIGMVSFKVVNLTRALSLTLYISSLKSRAPLVHAR